MTKSHNPIEFIRLLREHLAAHDRRIVFLFGAGTSASVGIALPPGAGNAPTSTPLIPTVVKMTEECKAAACKLSPEHAAAWALLENECNEMHSDATIERILGRLRLKLAAAAPREMTIGLSREQLLLLEKSIQAKIAELASPDEASIPVRLPHDRFARWVGEARRRNPIEIFTTNYDVLIERSFEHARVPTFDGFIGSYQPFFSPTVIANEDAMPRSDWTRIWKVHGSINWRVAADGSTMRTFGDAQGDMILPSHQKYDESRKMPYLALMDRLTQCLSNDGSLLVTCGYSWNDEHVNAAVLTALDSHPSNAAIALMRSSPDTYPELVARAQERDNLLVCCPREGVVRGDRAVWALPAPIDSATASFVDLSFDSDATVEPTDGPVSGSMRFGDFNHFCDFLGSMNDPEKSVQ